MLAIVSPPEIIHKPANKDVVEGAFVELLCDAQGMPQPEVQTFETNSFGKPNKFSLFFLLSSWLLKHRS